MTSVARPDEREYLANLKRRLARLYHDMNNPLAVASGNLQFVSELIRMGEKEGLSDAVGDTEQALERLESLVAQFLDVRADLDERLKSLEEPPT